MRECCPGWPGTWRSKLGVDAIEEPCTSSAVPRKLPSKAGEYFSQAKMRIGPLAWAFVTQCSTPTVVVAVADIDVPLC